MVMEINFLEFSAVNQWMYWIQTLSLLSLTYVLVVNLKSDGQFARRALLIVSSFVVYYALWFGFLGNDIAVGVFFGFVGVAGIVASRICLQDSKALKHGLTVLSLFLVGVIFYFDVFGGMYFHNKTYINLPLGANYPLVGSILQIYFKWYMLWGPFSVVALIYAFLYFQKSEGSWVCKGASVLGVIIFAFWVTYFGVGTLDDWNLKTSGNATNRKFDSLTKDIHYGFDVDALDKYGETKLHKAVKDGDFEEVKRLVEAGADVNIRSRNLIGGETPIVGSVSKNYDIFAYLIENGVKINEPVSYLDRPLIHLMDMKDVESPYLKLLLERGADVSLTDKVGAQLIHRVAELNQDPDGAYLEFLINEGVDVNVVGQFGGPLIHAASAGNINSVKTLIRLGADPKMKNKRNGTALEAAIRGRKIAARFDNEISRKKVERLDKVIEFLSNLSDEGVEEDGR
jgi:ankyrin repeat protein